MSFDERTVVARIDRLQLRELRLWVRRGWVRPAQGTAGPVFDDLDFARVQLLCELKQDMAVPTDALPVVLALVDRLNQTRREFRALTRALEDQPGEVRRAVLSRLRELQRNDTDAEGDQ